MQLIDLLTADDVVFTIRGADIGAAAASLLRITLPRHGVEPAETERLVQAVLARERETPTLCGAIAIPHARDARVAEFLVAIARTVEACRRACLDVSVPAGSSTTNAVGPNRWSSKPTALPG